MPHKRKSPAVNEASKSGFLSFNYNHIFPEKQDWYDSPYYYRNTALRLAEKNFQVFPCKYQGKTPITKNGYKDASLNAETICEWWNNNPSANIGIVTGQASGFWVLDIDTGGEETLQKLEAKHAPITQKFIVQTGSGGQHLYFRCPDGAKIPCSAGKLGQGLDVRGDGGYVIAPPSMHPNGLCYVWECEPSLDCLPYAPDWLLQLVIGKAAKNKSISEQQEDWRSFTNQGVQEGQRNEAIARMAGKLLRHGIDPYMTLDLCQCWNAVKFTPSLSQEEVYKTVNSIAGREHLRRGGQHAG